ncbi:hypothetical protein ABIE48_002998 [Paenibacillus sp. OAE614]
MSLRRPLAKNRFKPFFAHSSLAPLVAREIYYRIMRGSQGGAFKQLALASSEYESDRQSHRPHQV